MEKGIQEFQKQAEKLQESTDSVEINIQSLKNNLISASYAVKKAEEKLENAKRTDRNGQPFGDISAALGELYFAREIEEAYQKKLENAKADLEKINYEKKSLITQIDEYDQDEKKNLEKLRMLEQLEFGDKALPFFNDIVKRINEAEEMKAKLYKSMGILYSPKYYTGTMNMHGTGNTHIDSSPLSIISNSNSSFTYQSFQRGEQKNNWGTNVLDSSQNSHISSNSRMNNALYTDDREKVDKKLRPICGKVWSSLDQKTKNALYGYTDIEYEYINNFLAHKPIGNNQKETEEKIDCITAAINKSKLPEDMWLFRGVDKSTAIEMFGDLRIEHIQNMIRKKEIIRNDPFMSCGAAVGTGIKKDVKLEIYAPEGTKAMYMEPFSYHGYGEKLKWDGKSEQNGFSPEFEVLIQRETVLRPIHVHQDGSKLVIGLEIVG